MSEIAKEYCRAMKGQPTPDTDEAQFGTGRVSVEFARRLERERDAALKLVRELRDSQDEQLRSHGQGWTADCSRMVASVVEYEFQYWNPARTWQSVAFELDEEAARRHFAAMTTRYPRQKYRVIRRSTTEVVVVQND